MNAAVDALIFALDRVRNVMMALALIVVLKTLWIICMPAFMQN